MVGSVAEAFGVKDYNKAAVGAAVVACLGGKWLAETLSFIPGPGWLLKGMIASGITKAMGEGVIAYFRERSPLPKE